MQLYISQKYFIDFVKENVCSEIEKDTGTVMNTTRFK